MTNIGWTEDEKSEIIEQIRGSSPLASVELIDELWLEPLRNRFILDSKEPLLGLATTKQLIEELVARADVATRANWPWPTDRQITGPNYTEHKSIDLINELYYRAHVADQLGHEWQNYRTVDGGFSISVNTE